MAYFRIVVAVRPCVEQVVTKPRPPNRVEAPPPPRQEPRQHEILADVGLNLELEERDATPGVRPLGGDEQVVELFDETANASTLSSSRPRCGGLSSRHRIIASG